MLEYLPKGNFLSFNNLIIVILFLKLKQPPSRSFPIEKLLINLLTTHMLRFEYPPRLFGKSPQLDVLVYISILARILLFSLLFMRRMVGLALEGLDFHLVHGEVSVR